MTLVKDITACSTDSVRGLSQQIIAQINLVIPGVLVDFRGEGIQLSGAQVHPFLQQAARSALRDAVAERGQPILINSAYRTVAQQYLLRRQKEEGRCGITAAALPGKSNHEDGLALDVAAFAAWKPFLERHRWEQLGPNDPVHFTFVGGGTRDDLGSIGVKAFQTLWNRFHPTDLLTADGVFGPQTRQRLENSPAEGFPSARILRLAIPPLQGDDVLRVQEALTAAGFPVALSSVYDEATAAAVRAFQENKGLVDDGIVGPVTRRELGLTP